MLLITVKTTSVLHTTSIDEVTTSVGPLEPDDVTTTEITSSIGSATLRNQFSNDGIEQPR